MVDIELHSVFSIGGNSIEVVDEWLHLGHMINRHFIDDMDITLCKNRLIGNANRVLCHFGKLDSVIKNRLYLRHIVAATTDVSGCSV